MNFNELAKKRYSVRKFTDKKVEKEKLNQILDVARFAPSACNRQPWSVYVVTSDETLSGLKSAYNRDWIQNVSTIIVLTAHHDTAWHRSHFDNKDHSDVDLAILADHIILAATELGLGTCWVCAFDPVICTKALNISDENEEPVVMIPIGYSDPNLLPPQKLRKEFDEIVVYK